MNQDTNYYKEEQDFDETLLKTPNGVVYSRWVGDEKYAEMYEQFIALLDHNIISMDPDYPDHGVYVKVTPTELDEERLIKNGAWVTLGADPQNDNNPANDVWLCNKVALFEESGAKPVPLNAMVNKISGYFRLFNTVFRRSADAGLIKPLREGV